MLGGRERRMADKPPHPEGEVPCLITKNCWPKPNSQRPTRCGCIRFTRARSRSCRSARFETSATSPSGIHRASLRHVERFTISLSSLELARSAESQQLDDEHIVPRMDDWEVFPRVAAATATKAIEQGVAELSKTRDELYETASATIEQAREATQLLLAQGVIPAAPEP